ncbi:MAG: DUF885 family protein [Planctomycetota bacterium]
MRTVLIICLLALLVACAGDEKVRISADQQFIDLSQEYLDGYLAFRPVYATRLGIHDFDGKLPDLSPRAVNQEIERIHAFSQKFSAIPAGELSPQNLSDMEALEAAMDVWTSWLTHTHSPFRRDPLFYNDLIFESLELLLRRDFAPASVRMKALVSRLTHIPRLLEVARVNLTDVPEILREASEAALTHSLYMIRDQLPDRVRKQMNERLPEEFEEAHIYAVYAYQDFLLYVIGPMNRESIEHPAVGRDYYTTLWRSEESIELDVDATLELCARSREEVLMRMREVTRLVNPQSDSKATLARLQEDHESLKGVRDLAIQTSAALKNFVRESNLFSLPFEGMPDLKILPPDPRTYKLVEFMPYGIMDPKCRTAFVSLNPEPPICDVNEERIDALRFFTPYAITLLTAGATWPGSFVNTLNTQKDADRIRLLWEPATLWQGWAHYCEELVIDRGFDARPEALLTQLQFRLLEINRLEAACRIHCMNMPVAEAVEFMRSQSFITLCVARREVIEIARNPKVGAGFIGKAQILKLRESYLSEDSRRSLKSFHDLLLSAGRAPVSVIARKYFGKAI